MSELLDQLDQGQCPPPWPTGARYCINDVRIYWFKKVNGKMIVVGRPTYPVWPADTIDSKYIDAMRIVTDCKVHIYLYDMPDWQFSEKCGAVRFHGGQAVLQQYHDLGYLRDAKGRAYGVSFHAKYRTPKADRTQAVWQMDKVDFVLTDFPLREGERHECVTFDPGVCNPGDDPGGNPGGPGGGG